MPILPTKLSVDFLKFCLHGVRVSRSISRANNRHRIPQSSSSGWFYAFPNKKDWSGICKREKAMSPTSFPLAVHSAGPLPVESPATIRRPSVPAAAELRHSTHGPAQPISSKERHPRPICNIPTPRGPGAVMTSSGAVAVRIVRRHDDRAGHAGQAEQRTAGLQKARPSDQSGPAGCDLDVREPVPVPHADREARSGAARTVPGNRSDRLSQACDPDGYPADPLFVAGAALRRPEPPAS